MEHPDEQNTERILEQLSATRSCDSVRLRVTDWEKSQAYMRKDPPWFKVYRKEILSSHRFTTLPPKRRLLVLLLRAVATEQNRDNEIPLDLKWLTRYLSMRVTVDDLRALLDAGFVDISAPSAPDDPEVLPGRTRPADRKPTGTENENAGPTGYFERSELADSAYSSVSAYGSESGSEGYAGSASSGARSRAFREGVSESAPITADEIPGLTG